LFGVLGTGSGPAAVARKCSAPRFPSKDKHLQNSSVPIYSLNRCFLINSSQLLFSYLIPFRAGSIADTYIRRGYLQTLPCIHHPIHHTKNLVHRRPHTRHHRTTKSSSSSKVTTTAATHLTSFTTLRRLITLSLQPHQPHNGRPQPRRVRRPPPRSPDLPLPVNSPHSSSRHITPTPKKQRRSNDRQ
jgi:hypothetical protein